MTGSRSDSGRIRAVIADDEELGRERIRTMLARHADIELVAECTDGAETARTVREARPDLLFLDIQMPELSGFEVIDEVGAEHMPATVFVTAYDEYALKAFDVHAVDYLLKPYDAERFDRAVRRALGRHRGNRTADTLARISDDIRAGAPSPDHIAIKSRGRYDLVRIESIDWVAAAGNYVEIHAGGDVYLARQTMAAMEERLADRTFMRIHRSTIVNIDRIEGVHSVFRGEYEVRLNDGTKLAMSRGYRDRLDALIP